MNLLLTFALFITGTEAFSQISSDAVTIVCQEVDIADSNVLKNTAIVLEQTDGNAEQFLLAPMNAEAGFNLKFYQGASSTKIDEILKTEPTVYKGFATKLGHDRKNPGLPNHVNFLGKITKGGAVGVDEKSLLISYIDNGSGDFSTPNSGDGSSHYKCDKPKSNPNGAADVSNGDSEVDDTEE